MVIETPSRRMAWVARASRLLPIVLSGRLVMWLYPFRVARQVNAGFKARSSLGDVTLHIERPDRVATGFALRGFYEWRNVLIANALCRPGDTIIDVGSNIGTETLLFARRVGSAGQVVAFEPLPGNHQILKDMIELNRIDNVTLHQAAAADRPGTFSFSPPAEDEWNAGVGRLVEGAAQDQASIEVDVLVLDDLFREGAFAPPRLMVMDVEGAELSVLQGSRAILDQCAPSLILEVNPPVLAERGLAAADLFDFLERHNYTRWSVSTWGLTPACRDQEQAGNWLCIRDSGDGASLRLARKVARRMVSAALLPLITGLNPAVVA